MQSRLLFVGFGTLPVPVEVATQNANYAKRIQMKVYGMEQSVPVISKLRVLNAGVHVNGEVLSLHNTYYVGNVCVRVGALTNPAWLHNRQVLFPFTGKSF